MKVFIDTSALMALIFRDESYHQKVVNQFEDYKVKRAQMITSDYILDELFTRCVYKAGSHGAKSAVNLIQEIVFHNELTVIEVDSQVFKKAQEIFLKFSDHRISFTDATTYILYKDFGMEEVFTLDSDFKKIGVSTSM